VGCWQPMHSLAGFADSCVELSGCTQHQNGRLEVTSCSLFYVIIKKWRKYFYMTPEDRISGARGDVHC
jgi:hypothetical protein